MYEQLQFLVVRLHNDVAVHEWNGLRDIGLYAAIGRIGLGCHVQRFPFAHHQCEEHLYAAGAKSIGPQQGSHVSRYMFECNFWIEWTERTDRYFVVFSIYRHVVQGFVSRLPRGILCQFGHRFAYAANRILRSQYVQEQAQRRWHRISLHSHRQKYLGTICGATVELIKAFAIRQNVLIYLFCIFKPVFRWKSVIFFYSDNKSFKQTIFSVFVFWTFRYQRRNTTNGNSSCWLFVLSPLICHTTDSASTAYTVGSHANPPHAQLSTRNPMQKQIWPPVCHLFNSNYMTIIAVISEY